LVLIPALPRSGVVPQAGQGGTLLSRCVGIWICPHTKATRVKLEQHVTIWPWNLPEVSLSSRPALALMVRFHFYIRRKSRQ
jgi:hypothetical protein